MNSNKNKVNKNPQFTKVQITQNNPLEFDMSHDNISKALRDLKSLQYYIMGDEISGKDGTYHTHVYAVFSAPVRFSTLKKRFPSAHIEKAISILNEGAGTQWDGDLVRTFIQIAPSLGV